MKIAIVHYRYFHGDGPERYLFNIIELLERHGHTTAPFSIKNSRNEPTPYDKYFLESIDDEVIIGENSSMGPRKAVNSLFRMFYSPEARRKFGAFLDDFKPDLVYILQYHNKISPSILGEARKRGIPVVHRISDFQYMCPNATFFTDGHVCEDCLEGHSLTCIKRRCVHGSLAMSTMKLGAKKLHDLMGVTKKIDAFVVPSSFTLEKLESYGIPRHKLVNIPTFYNPRSGSQDKEPTFKPFFLYIGRLTPQKGLRTLVKAFATEGLTLKIVGEAADPTFKAELLKELEGKSHNIEFMGYKPFDQIIPLLRDCMATIVPSEWYDNFPNTILESFGFGKPVIASRLGSLLETVEDGVTGLTFTPGDWNDLRDKALHLINNPEEAQRLGRNAHQRVANVYTPESHYNDLVTLFRQVIDKKSADNGVK